MNKKVLSVLTVVIVIAFIILLWRDDQAMVEPVANSIPPKDTTAQASPIIKQFESASMDSAVEEPNPYQNELFKAQLLQVADLYAETSKYPVGSQPILNPADAVEIEPYQQTEVDTPFEAEDGRTIHVSAAVDQFQYFAGDRIGIRVVVRGAKPNSFVSVKASIAGQQGDAPSSIRLEPIDESQTEFFAQLDTQLVPPALFSTEMLLKVLVSVDDEPFFTTVGFRYSHAVAQLVGLGQAYPSGAELDIPLEFSVFQAGYYFVSAVLEDAKTGQPLLALQSEESMNEGNGRISLKAHFQALKVFGSQGPYVLRSIKAYRGAEQGETFDLPVSVLHPRFTVPGYPFSDYTDEPYDDPLAKEREEFLRGLGGLSQQEDIN